MARNFRGASRATGNDSARDRNERHSARNALAVVLALWTIGPEADLRRRRREFPESGEISGAAFSSQSAARCYTADGHRLESSRPNLLVHTSQHESSVRRDGAEVASGLAR